MPKPWTVANTALTWRWLLCAVSDANRSALAHLYRRAGFGARPEELALAERRGYAGTVAWLLDRVPTDPGVAATPAPSLALPEPPGSRAGSAARKRFQLAFARQQRQLTMWWLDRMASVDNPLTEKLTWFWHTHFATSVQKVRSPALMLRQNEIFRSMGSGGFDALTLTVARDPAMLIWLDAAQDRKAHPNENFSRELMELFTLGYGSYSELDVREAARCFTGWHYNRRTDQFAELPAQHDDGVKSVLGFTGHFDGADLIARLTHTNASKAWVISRLWSRFAMPIPHYDQMTSALLPAYGSALDIGSLLKAILLHPNFLSPTVRSGLVKQPLEYVVGTLRALRLPADSPALIPVLTALGELPFVPPNVGGWPENESWLSTGSSYERLRFAATAAARADLSAVADEPVAGRVDAAAQVLSVDGWSRTSAAALRRVADDPQRLMTLALIAPEYVLN